VSHRDLFHDKVCNKNPGRTILKNCKQQQTKSVRPSPPSPRSSEAFCSF
jgi:hypothetical protein